MSTGCMLPGPGRLRCDTHAGPAGWGFLLTGQIVNDDTDNQEKTQVIRTEGEPSDHGDPCLVAVSGSEIGRRYPLTEPRTTLGRSPDAGIVIHEQGVSRFHAAVERREDGLWIHDLESTNGTIVNGVRVREQLLEQGAQLRIGKALFKYLDRNNLETAYYDEVYRLTTIDDLTGAANRRHLFAALEKELARSIRHGRNLSLILFDIDRFKVLNDTYGHPAGDAVLTQIAGRIQPLCRDEDVFARYGGEEFAMLLPETDRPEAAAVAERMRRAVSHLPFAAEQWSLTVTISLGVSDLDEILGPDRTGAQGILAADHIQNLVRSADEKLYRAKETGRNRVIVSL